jgi:hypothetical protein
MLLRREKEGLRLARQDESSTSTSKSKDKIKTFFWEMVGFYWYKILTTKPLTRYPWKKIKLYIRPLQEHLVPFAVADHRCRKLDLLHLLQWRRSRMKLPADSRFDKESSNLKPISSTQCRSNVERLGQILFSPKTDASRNTGMLRPTSSNPTKGIQGHIPVYRSRWKVNLQGRDTNPVNTSPVKAPSLLRTTAKL